MIAILIATAVSAQPAPERVTCHVEAAQGHNIPVRVCMTESQREKRRAHVQQIVREYQVRSYRN